MWAQWHSFHVRKVSRLKEPLCQPAFVVVIGLILHQNVKCEPLAVTDSALLATLSPKRGNAVAHFSCHSLYRLVGSNHSRCLPNGTWTQPFPTCQMIMCESPVLPTDAHLVGLPRPKYNAKDIVVFGCRQGYMLTGNDFVICQSDGNWSDPNAKCIRYCRFPGRPAHGQPTTLQRPYYLEGEKLVFVCRPRRAYRLSGENVLKCLPSGQWSRNVPSCLPVVK